MSWKGAAFYEDPYVCSMIHLRDLGEQSPSGNPNVRLGKVHDHAKDLEEFKEHLRKVVELWDKRWIEYKDNWLWRNKSVHRVAFIQAVTCDLQPYAQRYLRKLGFKRRGPFSKLKHPESKVSVWIMGAPEFLEAIKE